MGPSIRELVRNRPLDTDFLLGLELVSTKIHPLAGATGRRLDVDVDPRLTAIAGLTPVGDMTFYEHIATVRHRPTETFYVAFRETMDAFLFRQKDPEKYPKWLMASPDKQAERYIHIYKVKCHPNHVPVLRSHEDWLEPIGDHEVPVFDALHHFLGKNGVVTEQVQATR